MAGISSAKKWSLVRADLRAAASAARKPSLSDGSMRKSTLFLRRVLVPVSLSLLPNTTVSLVLSVSADCGWRLRCTHKSADLCGGGDRGGKDEAS